MPSSQQLKIKGFKQVKGYLPCFIDPSHSSSSVSLAPGYVSKYLFQLKLAIDLDTIDSKPDPGSKQWLITQALSGDEEKETTNELVTEQSPSLVTSATMKQMTPGEDDDELPEDRFHRADASSTFMINQREQAVKDKHEKYEK